MGKIERWKKKKVNNEGKQTKKFKIKFFKYVKKNKKSSTA